MQRKNRERGEKLTLFFLATLFSPPWVLPRWASSKLKCLKWVQALAHYTRGFGWHHGCHEAKSSSLSRYQKSSSLFPRAVLAFFFNRVCIYTSASSKHNKNNARIKSNHEWSNSSDIARSRRVRRERENNGDEEEQKRERRDDYSSSTFEKKQRSSFRFEEYGEDDYSGNVHGKRLGGE